MSSRKNLELLSDIAQLLIKHGPNSFEGLAQLLREDRFLDDLVALLNASAKAGRRSKRPLGPKQIQAERSRGLNALLKHCESESPDKARALDHLYKKLVSKTVLPTLRDIRNFTEDNGMPPIIATSRQKAILPLLRSIVSAPPERITSLLETALSNEEKGERTLEGWTGLILGSNSKGTPESK